MASEAAKRVTLKSGRQLHVVVISCPPPGHALPCSQLARKLAARGVAVSVVSSDLHVQELQGGEISCKHPNIRLVGLRDGSRCSSITFWEMMAGQPEWETEFGGLLEALLVKMRDEGHQVEAPGWAPPCCLVADMFTLGWCQDIAVKLDLECHAFYPSPANALCFVIQVLLWGLLTLLQVFRSNFFELTPKCPFGPKCPFAYLMTSWKLQVCCA